MNKNSSIKAKINPNNLCLQTYRCKKQRESSKSWIYRDAKTRVKEQIGATHLKFEIVLETEAIKEDGFYI